MKDLIGCYDTADPKAQINVAVAEAFAGIGGTMLRNTEATDDVKTWTGGPLNYKEGLSQLATDELAKGINEEVVRAIWRSVISRSGDLWSFVSTPITHGWRWKNRTG